MKIGDLARRFDVPVETIRYYEREGLLSPAARTGSNYRLYTPKDADRLGFILNCRALDMAQDEIRVLLRVLDDPKADCGDVTAMLEEHIAYVRKRLEELKSLDTQLRRLRTLCTSSNAAKDCGILQNLSTGTRRTAKPRASAYVHGGAAHRKGKQA
jgi:Cd(II)/Pb(II)-responsive transcriptional regulator